MGMWACGHELPHTGGFCQLRVVTHHLKARGIPSRRGAKVAWGKVKAQKEAKALQAGRTEPELHQTIIQPLCDLGQLTDLL